MPNLTDLIQTSRETREIIKGLANKSGTLEQFTIGVPALVNTKFSLPARVGFMLAVATAAPIYFAPSSAATIAFFRILSAASTPAVVFDVGGPFDLSDAQVHVDAAQSGATLTAWITRVPDSA